MKKTVTVNLGGHAFIMDEDAYSRLNKYLNKIELEFKNANEAKEIIEDIEIRIAEILKETNRGRKEVVDIADIEEIINTIGNPSDFRQDFSAQEEGQYSNYKRIYRDPDNRWLGGVCGGLGAYFDIDPLIFRIIFILSIFIGAGPIVYLVMWIVIPEAVTVAQKLEMKGEPVNISNIGEKIKDEFHKVKRKMNL